MRMTKGISLKALGKLFQDRRRFGVSISICLHRIAFILEKIRELFITKLPLLIVQPVRNIISS